MEATVEEKETAQSVTGPLWYIWSNEHKGWWKAGHHGYTEDKREAGKYTQSEAINIVRQANFYLNPTDVPNEAMVLVE